MSVNARKLLRAGLLDGLTLAVAGRAPTADGSAGAAVLSAASELGAGVGELAVVRDDSAEQEEHAAFTAVEQLLAQLGSIGALVVDCASLSDARDGNDALIGAVAATWNAVRATAQLALLPAGAGGRILLLAPGAGGEHAAPAVAALENLARTLSIEWARHRITVVAIAPPAALPSEDLAALVCFLLSPAGAYFSGCLFDLRGGGTGPPPA
jgi:NAD(P)-dependent dehydrogenase (short-subunit alcohol dehydrogenase family)